MTSMLNGTDVFGLVDWISLIRGWWCRRSSPLVLIQAYPLRQYQQTLPVYILTPKRPRAVCRFNLSDRFRNGFANLL